MFTGIVEQVGRAGRGEADGRRLSRADRDEPGQRVPAGRQRRRQRRLPDGAGRRRTARFMPTSAPRPPASPRSGRCARGQRVNLERPLRADGRLGGHFVLGHVDGVGVVEEIRDEGESRWLTISFPPSLSTPVHPQGQRGRRRHQPDGGRARRAPLRRAGHPVHVRAHHARRPAGRATGSTSSATCSGSTSCGRPRSPDSRISAGAEAPRHGQVHEEAIIARKFAQRRAACRRRAVSAAAFSSVEDAVAAIRRGEMVIVVDDEDRENEGDLTIAAEKVTPEAINFMATHGRGLICLPMTGRAARRARDPAAWCRRRTPRAFDTAFCVSDRGQARRRPPASRRADRAATVLAAIDPKTKPADLARPGPHVPAARARRRRAGARRADRGGGRSGAHRRACTRPASSARS